MDRPEPLVAAADVVARRFPDATAAFLVGSVLTERRTETSDLDVVAVLAGRPAPYRETLRHDGWPVELFVHTRASLRHYWELDARARRAPLLAMCARGTVLVSEDEAAESIQAEARERHARGPGPLSEEEMTTRRYVLTDLLDDFRGCQDPTELAFIASDLLLAAGETALLASGGWVSRGKWLPRRLADLDADLLSSLRTGHEAVVRDPSAKAGLERAVLRVLDRAGGPLTEGYRVAGQEPETDP